jgi:hypothetical protein
MPRPPVHSQSQLKTCRRSRSSVVTPRAFLSSCSIGVLNSAILPAPGGPASKQERLQLRSPRFAPQPLLAPYPFVHGELIDNPRSFASLPVDAGAKAIGAGSDSQDSVPTLAENDTQSEVSAAGVRLGDRSSVSAPASFDLRWVPSPQLETQFRYPVKPVRPREIKD